MASRFDSEYDDYDLDGPPPEFWWRALENHLAGKAGQAMLREVEAALLALPKHRLINGSLMRHGEVCAVGAVIIHRRRQQGVSLREIIRDMRWRYGDEGQTVTDTQYAGEKVGLKQTMSWWLAYENDEANWVRVTLKDNETPEERWRRMLATVRGKMRATT